MNFDELKGALEALGARPALAVLAAVEDRALQIEAAAKTTAEESAKQIATLEERLKKAMEREKEAHTSTAELKRERDQLKVQVERMEAHPEVRAARRAALEAQAAELSRQAKMLADAELAPPPEPVAPKAE